MLIAAAPFEMGTSIAMALKINLLGPFAAIGARSETLNITSQRSRALLACLAIEPGNSWTRARLATLLWQSGGEQQQRSSLRQELAQLRKSLGLRKVADWGAATHVQMPKSVITDVALFRAAVAAKDAGRAASIWRGDLLQGSTLKDHSFVDWLALSRARLHKEAVGCFAQALSGLANDQDPLEFEEIAKRLVSLDPASEAGHVCLMRCAATRRDITAVVDRHRDYVAALALLRRKPSPAMQQLLERSSAIITRAPTTRTRGDSARWIAEINRQHLVAAAPPATGLSRIESAPSLAVMPFVDPSARAASTALADGLTEETTTAMARVPGLFVTARQSCMVYKNSLVDARTIASDLGVRYLLEGSVERNGKAIRINVRLIDGDSGFQVWANNYDALLADFFAVRNQIVLAVIGQLQPALVTAEIHRALNAPPGSLDAWTRMQRANAFVLFNRGALRLSGAVTELKQALAIDPDYAMAHAMLASVYTWRAVWSASPRLNHEHALALDHAERARKAAPDNSFVLVHCADTEIYSAGNVSLAQQLLRKAVEQNPADPMALGLLANANRVLGGDPTESLASIAQARRISPRDPRTHRWLHYAGWCHWVLGDLKQMEASARAAIELYSDSPAQWVELTCALGLQGKTAAARAAGKILKKLSPTFTGDGFYEIAQKFYGPRFTKSVKAGYQGLRLALQRAM
jgi:TolB-like protein/DNA-binding SARP family transcriptional activator